MNPHIIKHIFVPALIISSLTACVKTPAETAHTAETSSTARPSEQTITAPQTSAPDTYITESESTSVTEKANGYTRGLGLYSSFDIVKGDSSLTAKITLPDDRLDIESLKNYPVVSVTLKETSDLSFLTELTQMKGLIITHGESSFVFEPWSESYTESYDFLKNLDNLEYLSINSEPKFDISCLQDMDSLKYLWFYGTNIDFEGYFPELSELLIVGGELSSTELYDFFPNLTALQTERINISLESVGKMDKLETLYIGVGQSYAEINKIAGNNNLMRLSLAPELIDRYPAVIENGDFLLELKKLQYFWYTERTLPEETVNRFKEMNPDCKVWDYGPY